MPTDPSLALVRRLELVLATLADTNAAVRDLLIDLKVVIRDAEDAVIFPRDADLAPCPFAGQPIEHDDGAAVPSWVSCLCGRRTAYMPGDDERPPSIGDHRPGDRLRDLVDAVSKVKAGRGAPAAPQAIPPELVQAIVGGVLAAVKGGK